MAASLIFVLDGAVIILRVWYLFYGSFHFQISGPSQPSHLDYSFWCCFMHGFFFFFGYSVLLVLGDMDL